MSEQPPDTECKVRELLSDSQAGFLLEDHTHGAHALSERLFALRRAREEAVMRLAEQKGYNKPVQQIMDQIKLFRTLLKGRGMAASSTPGYSKLLEELKRGKQQRVVALHEDEDVRRVFDEYFAKEKPIRAHCKRAGKSAQQ